MRHLLVAGGSVAEWAAFSEDDWQSRLEALLDAARQGGAQFVTVHPHEPFVAPMGLTPEAPDDFSVPADLRRSVERDGVRVVIDPVVDGRNRILGVVSNWSSRRGLTEERLSRALFGDAGEPDLVVVLGPENRLPRSLVWELAYGELVFLPVGWGELSVEHLRTALDDFARRQRRFGGVD